MAAGNGRKRFGATTNIQTKEDIPTPGGARLVLGRMVDTYSSAASHKPPIPSTTPSDYGIPRDALVFRISGVHEREEEKEKSKQVNTEIVGRGIERQEKKWRRSRRLSKRPSQSWTWLEGEEEEAAGAAMGRERRPIPP
ncbi:MAG: hypothetical protein GY738_27770 [Pseudoalteromonas sp.]|nr:hypothetical protein [Pseudoalteromonas sp.]